MIFCMDKMVEDYGVCVYSQHIHLFQKDRPLAPRPPLSTFRADPWMVMDESITPPEVYVERIYHPNGSSGECSCF